MANETEENDDILADDSNKNHQKQSCLEFKGDTIFDACTGGEDNYIILQKMISDNVDVNQRNEDDQTPLGVAVCKGDLYAVDALINAGADIEISDNQLMTPLMMAAQLGFDSKLGFLLKNGANPMAVDKGGQSALHKTIRNKTVKCATALLDQCSELVHVKDHMEQTALHFAAGEGNDELIDILIAHGGEVDLTDRLGRAPLHWAILQGMDTCARKIGEHGGSYVLDTQDKLGMRPLHYALQLNNDNISTNLINQGCDVDAVDIRGQSGLTYASSCGRTDMCAVILDNSKNKNSVDRQGWTALHHAARKDHTNICIFLLDHGLDGNIQNNDGETALVLAVIHGNVKTVKTLCEKVDGWTHIKDKRGRYPIHHAVERGFLEITEILINALKRKCDSEPVVKDVICATDKLGASTLQIAALLSLKDCCQLLLDNDATIEDNVRPHLIRMGLIKDDTPKDEEEETEESEKEKTEETETEKENKEEEEKEEKEEKLTPRERYAPSISPPSTSSSDEVKSMSLSELLDVNSNSRSDDAWTKRFPPPLSKRLALRKEKERNKPNSEFSSEWQAMVEQKRLIEREMKIRKDLVNKSKFRKNQGRKSPYLESLVPPDILRKYSIGYLPPTTSSRLSGRIYSSKSVSSTTQSRAKSAVVAEDEQPCRLKGTLDQTPGPGQKNSRASSNKKFSYSVTNK